ncbi:MAG: hypothetical protein ACYSTZ_11345 [Planctomycetota bacterium]
MSGNLALGGRSRSVFGREFLPFPRHNGIARNYLVKASALFVGRLLEFPRLLPLEAEH